MENRDSQTALRADSGSWRDAFILVALQIVTFVVTLYLLASFGIDGDSYLSKMLIMVPATCSSCGFPAYFFASSSWCVADLSSLERTHTLAQRTVGLFLALFVGLLLVFLRSQLLMVPLILLAALPLLAVAYAITLFGLRSGARVRARAAAGVPPST